VDHQKARYVLAVDKVRYVGEPVAFIAAQNRYMARDATEMMKKTSRKKIPV